WVVALGVLACATGLGDGNHLAGGVGLALELGEVAVDLSQLGLGLGEPAVDAGQALLVRLQTLARDLELGLELRLLLLAGAVELATADLAGALDALLLGESLGALLVEA